MDLIKFIGLKVKIILKNDYYYVGEVLNANETSIDLLDMRGQRVALSEESISSIQEVKR